MDPLEIVGSVADAAFGIDEEGRVVIWNREAEKLTGFESARILGKACHDVLCGMDVFGNRFCDETCAVRRMVARKEALHGFELDIRTASGKPIRVAFTVLLVPGPRPSQHTLLHLFRPVDRGGEAEKLLRRVLAQPPAPNLPGLPVEATPAVRDQPALTAREIEILRLMADGASTTKIADNLFISTATVRNHVQNILRKLDVHSKLEAVSLALRCRMI